MIPIRNIYYMLAYAFRALRSSNYKKLESEQFENVYDLLAEILVLAMQSQIKRGLVRGYVDVEEEIPSVRGRIDFPETLRARSLTNSRLVCEYDELTLDVQMNQIVKATFNLLLKTNLSGIPRKKIRALMPYLEDVSDVDLSKTVWILRYNSTNQTYQMMINVCKLIHDGVIMSQDAGSTKLREYLDDQSMHRLYEKFILEYFRKEHVELSTSSPQIPWAIRSGETGLLPKMQSDITLASGKNKLIIDAKYYGHTLQKMMQFSSETIHSGNLYQIFAYVKNAALAEPDKAISGMLLYARTEDAHQPDEIYDIDKNMFYVRTLDLSCRFEQIRRQLDDIALIAKNI